MSGADYVKGDKNGVVEIFILQLLSIVIFIKVMQFND